MYIYIIYTHIFINAVSTKIKGDKRSDYMTNELLRLIIPWGKKPITLIITLILER